MKIFTAALGTFVTGTMLFLGTGFANETDISNPESRSMKQERSMNSVQNQENKKFVRTSELMDKAIKNDRGEKLGSVDELVFSNDGKLKYLVLLKGGTLGIGGDLIPVPFEAVKDSFTVKENEIVISALTEHRIDNAPSVSRDELANLEQNERISDEANAYFGQQDPGIQTESEPKTNKFSEPYRTQKKDLNNSMNDSHTTDR